MHPSSWILPLDSDGGHKLAKQRIKVEFEKGSLTYCQNNAYLVFIQNILTLIASLKVDPVTGALYSFLKHHMVTSCVRFAAAALWM